MTAGFPRVFTVVSLATIVVTAVVATRVAVSGRDDLATAIACQQADLPATAIDFAARAARWYLPLAGVSRPARELLRDLAKEAGAVGNPGLELQAWQELRGAIRSTRWMITPDTDLLDEADASIARGLAAIDRLPDGRAGLDEAGHLAFLKRDSMPRNGPSAAAVILFVAWLSVTAAGAFRSVTPEGRLRGGAILFWGLGSLTLLAGWLIALSLA